MKKLVFAAFIAAFAAGAHAAPPSEAAIRELMDVTNARANMAASLQNMSKVVPQLLRMRADAALRNPKLTEEQRKAETASLERRLPMISAALQKEMTDPKLVDELYKQVVPLYASHFTAEDVKALTAFYRSPAGKKSLEVMPQLVGESAQAAQKLMQERAKRIIEQTK